jgi:hypothetical protein
MATVDSNRERERESERGAEAWLPLNHEVRAWCTQQSLDDA